MDFFHPGTGPVFTIVTFHVFAWIVVYLKIRLGVLPRHLRLSLQISSRLFKVVVRVGKFSGDMLHFRSEVADLLWIFGGSKPADRPQLHLFVAGKRLVGRR